MLGEPGRIGHERYRHRKARAWRIQLTLVRQRLLSPANAMLGYAEIVHEEATRQCRPDILPDLSRILAAARDLAGKVDQLVDGGHARAPPGPVAATHEQELRHELRTPLNAIKGYGEMLRQDMVDFSSDSPRADLDRLLATANDLLLRLDRILQLPTDVGAKSLDPDQPGAIMLGDSMRGPGPPEGNRILSSKRAQFSSWTISRPTAIFCRGD